jgi:hypothetical protein
MDDLKPAKDSKAAKSRTIDFHASGRDPNVSSIGVDPQQHVLTGMTSIFLATMGSQGKEEIPT